MGKRSSEFVGIAESIKSHELSRQSRVESLKAEIFGLASEKLEVKDRINDIEASIAAEEENMDEDGDCDWSRIAQLEADLNQALNELSDVEQSLQEARIEMTETQEELEEILREKEETLHEIQERARQSAQNISIAGGMYGAYAGVGASLQRSLQGRLDLLAQAAGILGSHVDGASAGGGSGGYGGMSGGSKSGGGSLPSNSASGILGAFIAANASVGNALGSAADTTGGSLPGASESQGKGKSGDSVSKRETVPRNQVDFTSKNFEKLAWTQGEDAYQRALKSGATEEEADQARRVAKQRIFEKMESSGKYSPEANAIRHANAEAEKAYAKAIEAGKTERQAQIMKNETLRSVYTEHWRKKAYKDEMLLSHDQEKAVAAGEHAAALAAQRVKGSKVDRIKPGAGYYEIYEANRKTPSRVMKAKNLDVELMALRSKEKSASGQFLGVNVHASPEEDVNKKALPNSNEAEVAEKAEVQHRNKFGNEVLIFINTVGAQNHQRDDPDSAFYRPGTRLDGGDTQYVLSTGGTYDDSVRIIPNQDTEENIRRKEAYISELAGRVGDLARMIAFDYNLPFRIVTGEELDLARLEFNRNKNDIIRKWEEKNKQTWPTYTEDVYSADGHLVRRKGDKYDAHHIHPLSLGGRNTAANMIPLHYNDHIGENGIHYDDAYQGLV